MVDPLFARPRARLSVVALAALLFVAPACKRGDAALEAQIQGARAHLAAGEPAKAIAAFEKALALKEQVPTLLALAQLHASRGEWARAEGYLERARKLEPDSVDVLAGLADMAATRGKVDEARQHYTQLAERLPVEPTPRLLLGALADSPASAEPVQLELAAWRERAKVEDSRELRVVEAVLYRTLGEPARYRGALEQGRALPTTDVERATRLARLYLKRKEWAAAQVLLEGATQKAPKVRTLWLLLAAAALENGDHEPARQALEIADRLPHEPPQGAAAAEAALLRARVDIAGGRAAAARDRLSATLADAPAEWISRGRIEYWLARALLRLDDETNARRHLDAVPSESDARGAAQLLLAELDVAAGAKDLARARLESAMTGTPPEGSYLLLARLNVEAERGAEAEKALRQGLEARPDSVALWLALGKLLQQKGHLPRAAAAVDQALKREPGHAEALGLRAQLASAQGDEKAAIGHYRNILQGTPRHAAALNNLALLLAASPEGAAESVELARAAQAARPDDLRIADTLGWVLHLAGQSAEALPWLRKAAEAMGQDPAVQYHLGAALAASGDKRGAKDALRAALERSQEFQDADAARALLAEL